MRLPRAELMADVTRLMGATRGGERDLRVGLEAELIPVSLADGARARVESVPGGPPALLPLVERAADRAGGTVERTPTGSPRGRLPGLGVLTFEPGAQLEFASAPFSSVDALLDATRAVLEPLAEDAHALGIGLLTRGMDPGRSAAEIPLAFTSERYRKQRDHYDRIGPWGAEMMVLSAGLHLNLDLGGRPLRRWWVANRMAAVLTALCANSPEAGDADRPGCRSARAERWRNLDPTRTGVFGDHHDAPTAYLAFALGAQDFLGAGEGETPQPFREAWERGADGARWKRHLTTLFPEVRPRGYLELRSADALRPAWYAVPLVLAFGLLYDPQALTDAESVLPPADAEGLRRAGRLGTREAGIRDVALEAIDLGLEGARRLGPERVGGALLERVEEYRRRFPERGCDPGDEPDGLPLFDP